MKLDDAIFNWLQIRHVAEMKPDDEAAQDTYEFFTTILEEDHHLTDIEVKLEDNMHIVSFVKDEQERSKTYPSEFVHQLYHDLENMHDQNQTGC
ncbi:hypothetical protein [Caldalkalibacillus salinus]|uniref:hypothetical protein n=1 Tax=Caldalkalibacillus salinus TaxID=2803787 RepID=UPI0019233E2B|nr:hypothetical protein [Caldalkalibacillus salinus]